jgi:glucose-1-phosphate thymidylyltransferase
MSKHQYYGLLPAAGQAMRMRPFRYPKELLPVHYCQADSSGFVQPKLLIEHSLEAFSLALVDHVYIVVPEWKPEIMRYLQDGKQFNHHISYLYNSDALGLADALLSGSAWLSDKHTCFAMPDTLFSPANSFEHLIDLLENSQADLVLGVFPTDEPQHFAPVEFDETGKVLNIEEKPLNPKVNNAWGIAVWTPAFWSFFNQEGQALTPGISITQIFDKAVKTGLKVNCIYFANGWYKDIGRINHISVSIP